jgi:eukaryotic-like serine/threonine-protein kinase
MVLLLIMGLFGLRGYHRAKTDSDNALTARLQEKNRFAAKAVAGKAAAEIQRYFRAVERVAEGDTQLAQMVWQFQQADSDAVTLLEQLRDPNKNLEPLEARDLLIRHPSRQPLQQRMEQLLNDDRVPHAASWFVTDAYGTQVAAAFDEENFANTVGQNYGWRTYFHGGPDDLVRRTEVADRVYVQYEPPPAEGHISDLHLSAPFQSKATNKWKVAAAAPIFHEQTFVGIVALTVDIGVFVHFDEGTERLFAALVDARPGINEGMILQHPLFDQVLQSKDRLPDEFSRVRVQLHQFENGSSRFYEDPLAVNDVGRSYRKRWIAAMSPVVLEHGGGNGSSSFTDTGLKVIVQEDYGEAMQPVHDLGLRLLREGLLALGVVVVVILIMWAIVLRAMRDNHLALQVNQPRMDPTPLHDRSTIAAPRRRDA